MVLRLRYGRTDSIIATANQEEKNFENEFLNLVRNEESEKIRELAKDPTKCLQLSQNWDLIRKCARTLMDMDSPALVKGRYWRPWSAGDGGESSSPSRG